MQLISYQQMKLLFYSKGYSIQSICNELSISRTGLKRSIDNCSLSFNRVLLLCSVLGVTPNDIITTTKERTRPTKKG